MQNLLVNSYQ